MHFGFTGLDDVADNRLLKSIIDHRNRRRSAIDNRLSAIIATSLVSTKPRGGDRRSKLDEHDLDMILALKKVKPSTSLKSLQDKLSENSGKDVYKSEISRALHKNLQEGEWTMKVLTKTATERITPENERYTQAYLDEINANDPLRLKFMDEAGFALSEAVNKKRGHAPKGHRAIEVQSFHKTANLTLSLLGLDGTVFSTFVDGACNQVEFLRFFDEAGTSFNDDGTAVLQPGDVVVVDNATINRFDAERVLRQFFNNIGVKFIFLPKYSPDMNPIEFAFNFIRTMLKSDEFAPVARNNLRLAILKVLDTLSLTDIHGFYQKVGYINV